MGPGFLRRLVSGYAKHLPTVEGQFKMLRKPKPGIERVTALIADLEKGYPEPKEIEERLTALYAEMRTA